MSLGSEGYWAQGTLRYRISGPWGAAYRGNTGNGGPKYRTGNDGPCRVECRMPGGSGLDHRRE